MSQKADETAPARSGAQPVLPEPDPDSLPTAAVDALLALSDAAVRSTRPDDLLQQIVSTAADLLGLPWGVLLLRDPDTDDMRLVAVQGAPLTAFPAVLQMPRPTHVNRALFGGPPFILEDYQGGPPLSPVWWEPAARLGLRAVLAVPLPGGDDYIGSLHVAGPQPHRFRPVEVALLQRLARLAGQVLVHTRTLSAVEQRAGALESMQAVARSLEATLDLDTVLGILVERSVEIMGATGGMLMLWDDAQSCLIMRKVFNIGGLGNLRVAPGEGVTGTAFASGQPYWQNNYRQFDNAVPLALEERITGGLAVPLLRQGRPFGTITVFSKVFKPFTLADARMLALFASQAAVAIDNQVLYTTVTRQERQLDSIIRALHDGLIVYDRAGRLLLINRAAEEMLGLNPRIVGVDPVAIAQDRERYIAYRTEFLHDRAATVATVLEQGITLAGMARIHSDPIRTVEAFYSPYNDETGTVAGIIALFHDVSAAQELERLRAELEVARQQEDFLSIASHELRTPITAIKGFSDLLERRLVPDYTTTARDAAMLHSIATQVGRLAGLVDDLLDVANLRSGTIAFRWEECSPVAVLQAALDSVRPIAGARESDLHLVDDPSAGAGQRMCIRADPARLEQVFVNLLTNALKYSSAGPITCTISRAGATVLVAVQDHGKGIAPADLPHLFERFFRSHDVYAHQQGIGLGLYISRQIVERHQGRIWVESTLGQGATFYVELPVAGAPVAAP